MVVQCSRLTDRFFQFHTIGIDRRLKFREGEELQGELPHNKKRIPTTRIDEDTGCDDDDQQKNKVPTPPVLSKKKQ